MGHGVQHRHFSKYVLKTVCLGMYDKESSNNGFMTTTYKDLACVKDPKLCFILLTLGLYRVMLRFYLWFST